MSLVPIACFHFIFWGPDFHRLKPDFQHLRAPTFLVPYCFILVAICRSGGVIWFHTAVKSFSRI
jgi:hypothetical protein